MKYSNLYLGLVVASGGWQSLIVSAPKSLKVVQNANIFFSRRMRHLYGSETRGTEIWQASRIWPRVLNLDVAQFSEIEISLFLQTFNGQLGFQELRVLVPMLKDFYECNLGVFLIS